MISQNRRLTMKDNQAKYPQLRFKGFTDPWEQRKLIEVADYRNGKAHEKDISENGDYIVVNSKFVSTNGAVKKFSDELIAPLKKGELAFVLSDVPNGRAIARTFLIDEDNKYSLNQRIAGIAPHSDTNSYFLHSLMNRHHYFLRFDDGAGQTNLSKKEVENWTELYPSIEEQDKIGSFFKQLDDTITLHQRKLAKLKELKQGYLQKMFPQNASKFPQLRFAGFADDWEERKLGDVFSERSERSGEGELISVTINSGVVKASELYRKDNSSDDKSNYKKVEVGDIAYNSMRMWQGASGYSPYNGILSPAYTVIIPKEGNDSKFLAYDFKRYDMIQTFKRNSQGLTSDTWNLKFPTLKSVKVMVPSLEEQQRISTFFESLDTTITLHQRKLEKLQELKKGYLQKMFC
ncbi:restriction endonuclease subunit S [Levilactobacillus sp. HBUAS70063]|uniref:restriction endonuclease subunit S n=1 Tax=Levilactobacillus sp. HBUAS70063 TaxID=3109359 RepID=UPI0040534D59